MSTFALVIGKFCLETSLNLAEMSSATNNGREECDDDGDNGCNNHIKYPCRLSDSNERKMNVIPARLFSLESGCILSIDFAKFSKFVYCSLDSCFKTLGPHPFHRLDLVIMSRWFPHMGLASPSMIFLSPSNFTGSNDPQFVCRIPHEIFHSWFGLLIGALDWTEEWLSEGFATYCEDIVFEKTYRSYFPNKSEDEVRVELELKIFLRLNTLQNELRTTETDLRSMGSCEPSGQFARNGLVPIKQFMHLHYFKGYLLLQHLSQLVGKPRFLNFLRRYVQKYHGQLVSSTIFLNYFYETFCLDLKENDSEMFINVIKESWLGDELPAPFNLSVVKSITSLLKVDEFGIESIPLFSKTAASLRKVQIIHCNLKQKGLDANSNSNIFQDLTNSEVLLLLAIILDDPENKDVIKAAYSNMAELLLSSDEVHLSLDVLHCWCELIILCNVKSRRSDIESFLENHVAMGVYLYGELMISERSSFQKLAKDVFRKLENLYDLGTKRLIKEMLF